jgi:hypothetical protein
MLAQDGLGQLADRLHRRVTERPGGRLPLGARPRAGAGENVGSMLLTVTQQLVDSGARSNRALLELGYLSGAVHRGAAHAQVDAEIERRIDQEIGAVDTRSPAFVRGERAGRSNG